MQDTLSQSIVYSRGQRSKSLALDEAFVIFMRLWTGSSKPWVNELSAHLFKTWRWYLVSELSEGQWILSMNAEVEMHDGEYSDILGYYACGIRTSLDYGYECYQYDGFHKVLSLGPLFISWFTEHE